MFQFFNRTYFPEVNALDDPKDERDYQIEEVAKSYAPVEWKEKKQSEWRKFPIFNQGRAGSCVAHSVAKLLGIEFYNYSKKEYNIGEYVDVSKRDIYTRRANKPNPGMWFRDGMDIARDGVTLEALMPVKMTEAEMNDESDRMKFKDYVGKSFSGHNFLATPLDIDSVAIPVEAKHGVMIGMRFEASRYNRPVPLLPTKTTDLDHHAITVVDHTIWENKKALVIDDSWGINTGFNGQRVVTEDWFKAGLISASWFFEDLEKLWNQDKNAVDNTKPKHQFKNNLRLGQKNADVKKLQECLDWLGLYGLVGTYTGHFGGITLRAVNAFQEKYAKDVLHPIGLIQPTGVVGELTRKKLNELFR